MIQSATFWCAVGFVAASCWLVPSRYRPGYVALASIAYLATLSPWNMTALLAWTLVFFLIAPATATGSGPKWLLSVLVLAILGYLACFKYIPPLLHALAPDRIEKTLLIPLGISYFSFKFIHYAIEVSRGNITDRSFTRFLCYIFLFPIFTAGPIERYDHFLANREETFSLQSCVEGITRIIYGLIKKLFLAEMVVKSLFLTVTSGNILLERLTVLPTWKVWGFLVLSYLVVYLDFSAYSDIAIGVSRLFGFRIMENFRFPLGAPNISNFWKRWHISLSSWCQTYAYMPMIGLTRNPYLAAYTSFLVMGLWHAGTLNRVLWGLYQATGISGYMLWTQLKRRYGRVGPPQGAYAYLGIPLTTLFVVPSMAFVVVEGNQGSYAALRILAKLVFVNLPQ